MKVQLLGGFQILDDNQPVEGFESFRLQSLFAYILLHSQTPIPRRQIAFLLWPDSTEAQAMANLRFLVNRENPRALVIYEAILPRMSSFLADCRIDELLG